MAGTCMSGSKVQHDGFPMQSLRLWSTCHGFFEDMALKTALTRERYVDDIFCILRKGKSEEFLRHLNRLNSVRL